MGIKYSGLIRITGLTGWESYIPGWPGALQQQKLQAAPPGQAGNNFQGGYPVSISNDGNTVIVGAYLEDVGGGNSGAAYIFTRSGTTWTQQQELTASDEAAGDFFGNAVSISGDGNTVVVGAPFEDTGASNAGAAYIFTRSGVTWTEQQKIQAADFALNDNFGASVGISDNGSVVAVGSTTSTITGKAYVFTLSGSTWVEDQQITPSLDSGDKFGVSIGVSGDGATIIVGATSDDDTASGAGAVYIFTESGGTWTQEDKFQGDDLAANDAYGQSVSLSYDGNTAIVGAYLGESGILNTSGNAYVHTRSGSVWSQQAKLVASDAASSDRFGVSVSISSDGNTAIAGAYFEDPEGISNAGSAYVFTRSGSTWTEQKKLQAADAETNDYSGWAVGMSGDGETAIVGAAGEDTGLAEAGAAYVFVSR